MSKTINMSTLKIFDETSDRVEYTDDVTPSNVTNVIDGPQIWSLEHLVVTSVILVVLILCAIIGNVFVIAAIISNRSLRRPGNYLILSLAVADMLVASIVMPISAVNEVSQTWFLGYETCVMWIFMDILCCTASILNLVAISIHRYWTVTNIDYMQKQTVKHILVMIIIVWVAAFTISFPSILLFHVDNDPTKTLFCSVSQNHIYTIFSTVGAFYLPTFVLLIVYIRIYCVARERIRRKKFSVKLKMIETKQNRGFPLQSYSSPEVSSSNLQRNENSGSKSDISESSLEENNVMEEQEMKGSVFTVNDGTMNPSNSCDDILKAQKQKQKVKRKRERKVAGTLTIVTGVFIFCWLPFFVVVTATPFMRPEVEIPRLVARITLWLGYCNSLLNPVIYTVFIAEFRTAFKNIVQTIFKALSRCCKSRNHG